MLDSAKKIFILVIGYPYILAITFISNRDIAFYISSLVVAPQASTGSVRREQKNSLKPPQGLNLKIKS